MKKKMKNYKRVILTIIIICSSFLCVLGCSKDKNDDYDNHSFFATIVEINNESILVQPNDDEEELNISDRYIISLSKFDQKFKLGERVKITYKGGINESYPAQIDTINIEIVN